MNCFYAREEGFSLVELMVAVGIIGVMSSVAVPKYQKFKANAAQSEAQATLSSIYTLQQLFYTENDHYGEYEYTRDKPGEAHELKKDQIQFEPPESARYWYTGSRFDAAHSTTSEDSEAVSFKVVANSQTPLGSCAREGERDIWCINESKHLSNTKASAPCTTKGDTVAADYNDGGCTYDTAAPPPDPSPP